MYCNRIHVLANGKQLIEGVNHKQVLSVIVIFCSIELAYSLGQEDGMKRQRVEECVLVQRATTNGLLLTKSLLFFVLSSGVFGYCLIQAPRSRNDLLIEHNGNLDSLEETLNAVNNYSQLLRECLLGLLGSLNVLLRASLMFAFRDHQQYMRPTAWITLCIQFAIFALYQF